LVTFLRKSRNQFGHDVEWCPSLCGVGNGGGGPKGGGGGAPPTGGRGGDPFYSLGLTGEESRMGGAFEEGRGFPRIQREARGPAAKDFPIYRSLFCFSNGDGRITRREGGSHKGRLPYPALLHRVTVLHGKASDKKKLMMRGRGGPVLTGRPILGQPPALCGFPLEETSGGRTRV